MSDALPQRDTPVDDSVRVRTTGTEFLLAPRKMRSECRLTIRCITTRPLELTLRSTWASSRVRVLPFNSFLVWAFPNYWCMHVRIRQRENFSGRILFSSDNTAPDAGLRFGSPSQQLIMRFCRRPGQSGGTASKSGRSPRMIRRATSPTG